MVTSPAYGPVLFSPLVHLPPLEPVLHVSAPVRSGAVAVASMGPCGHLWGPVSCLILIPLSFKFLKFLLANSSQDIALVLRFSV